MDDGDEDNRGNGAYSAGTCREPVMITLVIVRVVLTVTEVIVMIIVVVIIMVINSDDDCCDKDKCGVNSDDDDDDDDDGGSDNDYNCGGSNDSNNVNDCSNNSGFIHTWKTIESPRKYSNIVKCWNTFENHSAAWKTISPQ